MSKPFYAVIIPLGEGPVDPGFGRPGGGGGSGNRPDQGLPGGQGGHPSQPIYHPGHPDHGLPPFPDQGLPGGGQGGRPDQGLPPFPSQGLPEGGTDIPSNELPMPEPPQEYENETIVAVKKPGEEWVVKAYEDVGISNPQPTPQPQHRRR